MLNVATVEPLPEVDEDFWFWSQRPILGHVHTFARSRSVSPYATLGCVLRRAIASVEPNVMLPPTVGGTVSANFYTISAGRSGQGKDAADSAGFAAIHFYNINGTDLEASQPNIGSGEGLARAFKGHKGDEDRVTRAHVRVNEVKTLEGLLGRKGATLEGELLKAYMGQPLGFSNAQKDTTTAVEAHSYRLCMGVGVQPENAGFFLSREKDGLPQRFLWLPTTDPHAPRDRPEEIDPIDVVLPDFGNDEYLVKVPAAVVREIVGHRHLVLIGSEEVDALDGHLMLTRLKVSFALALLDGCKDISEEDWRIAGELLEVSRRVRDDMRFAVEEKRRRENAARANADADRQAILDARLDDDRQKRVAKAITAKLKRTRRATRRQLRMACTQAIRGDFDTVFDLFVDKGFLICIEGGEGRADEYELNPE
jgi:hypothetical protein